MISWSNPELFFKKPLNSQYVVETGKRFATPFHKVLPKVLGFYLIEERLSNSLSSEIFTHQDLDRMWNQTLEDLQAMVDADLSARPEALLSTVKLILALSLLLGHLRAGVTDLDGRPVPIAVPGAASAEVLSNRPMFGNVVNCSRLLQRCKERGGAIGEALLDLHMARAKSVLIEEETCQPCGALAKGSKEWNLANFRGLQEVVVHNEYFPPVNQDADAVSVACSSTVFKLCALLDELVETGMLFHVHLDVRFGDEASGDDLRGCSELLSAAFHKINLIMTSTITNNDVSLELLCQYYVNWIFMTHVANSFQQQWSPPQRAAAAAENGSHRDLSQQQWASTCEATAESLFGKLLEIIPQKLLALLSSSVSIDWTPTKRAEGPHEFMSDLLQYLTITFGPDSATRLLPTVKYQTVLFKSCETISSGLLEIICDADIGQINAVAFEHLSLDVEAVVAFARENPVKDLEECFIQLHQTVALFVKGDIELYLDLNERVMKYPNVKATSVLQILRKYKTLGVTSRLFSRSQSQNFASIDGKMVQLAITRLSQELGEI